MARRPDQDRRAAHAQRIDDRTGTRRQPRHRPPRLPAPRRPRMGRHRQRQGRIRRQPATRRQTAGLPRERPGGEASGPRGCAVPGELSSPGTTSRRSSWNPRPLRTTSGASLRAASAPAPGQGAGALWRAATGPPQPPPPAARPCARPTSYNPRPGA